MTQPVALQGLRRWARRHLHQRATIRRRTHTAGGNPRLSEGQTTVATNVPFLVQRSPLSPAEDVEALYQARLAQYWGHCPLGTDIRRHDEVEVDGVTYRVLGPLYHPGYPVDIRVVMEVAQYDEAEMP